MKGLLSGIYWFSPLQEIRTKEDVIELWAARDALVLKAMALVLNRYLSPILSDRCQHLKGNDGAKKAVGETLGNLACGTLVMKSDVKGYYTSIDHDILLNAVEALTTDPGMTRLIRQYLKRTVCFGENYREINRGISLGCPLSPLMGALYLKPLDDAADKTGLSLYPVHG